MLRTDAEAAVDVIYQEFVLRRVRGESPRPEVYLRRFPAWADALIRQFAVDEALRPLDGATTQSPGPAVDRNWPESGGRRHRAVATVAVDRRL